MYKFTEKINDKQKQTTYVLYMIISSYFHKSIFRNKVLETSLFLHYWDMSDKGQERLEEKVIRSSEKNLKEVAPALSRMNCEVSIRRKNGAYYLDFLTGFERVAAVVAPNGDYRIWTEMI